MDRYPLGHARASCLGRHCLFTPPRAQPAFCPRHRLFRALVSNLVPLYGTIFVIIAVYVVCWISFGTRVLNNSMIQVHRELEEAAQVGGVSTFRVLWNVIVPLVRPGLVYAWIWTSLSAYRELT